MVPDAFLQASGVSVADAFDATPPTVGARRGAGPPELVIDIDLKPGEAGVLAIRHPSGALTFHVGEPPVGRGRTTRLRLSSLRFQVPVRRVGGSSGRRGIVGQFLADAGGIHQEENSGERPAAFRAARTRWSLNTGRRVLKASADMPAGSAMGNSALTTRPSAAA